MTDRSKIYLRAVRDGDRFKVVDQDGREVAMLRGVVIDAGHLDDVVELTIRVLDSRETTGRPHSPKG